MSELHESLEQWARFYVSKRQWKLIPIHVLVNGQCSCGKFPCGEATPDLPAGKNAGKHPVQTNWSNAALAVQTLDDVPRWWSGRPDSLPYSIGLLCGQPSGVVILDVDPRNGGFESLDELEENIGPLPYTLKAISGSGGLHFYFNTPPGVRIKKGPLHKELPGLDFQSDGSQTLIPPSSHASGNHYKWADGMSGAEPIANLPDDLLRLAMERKGGGGASGDKLDYDAIHKNGIGEGERNNTLYKVAVSQWRKNGVDDPDVARVVVSTIKAYNSDFCSPPLDADEVALIIDSAYSFVKDNPNDALTDAQKAWIEQRQEEPNKPVLAATPATLPDTAADKMSDAEDAAESAAPEPEAGPSGGDGDAGDGDGGSGGGGNGDGGGGGGQDWFVVAPEGDVPGNRERSDVGNSRRLVDEFGDRIRYTPGLGWLTWGGTHWVAGAEPVVNELAKNLPARILAESEAARAAGNATKADELSSWSRRSQSGGSMSNAVKWANSDARIHVPLNRWNSRPDLLACENGVVDLVSGRLRPVTRTDLFTHSVRVPYVPGHKDPTWSRYLWDATGGDEEFAQYLKRAVGYTISGYANQEIFFLAQGISGTGKSTFVESITALLGMDRWALAYALPAEAIVANTRNPIKEHQLADLFGKRLVTAAEPNKGAQWDTGLIKNLTGQDAITGAHKYKDSITFVPQFVLWITANMRPSTNDDDAIWRRMRLLPFTHRPAQMDPTVKPYLKGETGSVSGQMAVLAWAVEGAVEFMRDGLGTAEVVEMATLSYQEQEDRIGQFMREMTEPARGEYDPYTGAGGVQIGPLYARFQMWAKQRGGGVRMTAPALAQALEARGIKVVNGVVPGYELKEIDFSQMSEWM